jgi:putative flippase GtrA
MERPSFLISLTRSQVSSFAATVVDFTTLVFFVEVLGVWYVLATVFGAIAGAITNFMLGRHWSFVATDGRVSAQALKYAAVSGMSLALNTFGVYFITDHLGVKYTLSKVITAFLVGIFFNFPLHRKFVFRAS